MTRHAQSQPSVPAAPRLLTVSQVATRLNVHRTTVYGLFCREGLPMFKLGARSTRVDEAELQAWIEARKQQAS